MFLLLDMAIETLKQIELSILESASYPYKKNAMIQLLFIMLTTSMDALQTFKMNLTTPKVSLKEAMSTALMMSQS